MGSLTLTLVGDGTVGTKTKTYAVPDADINRFVVVWKAKATTLAVPTPTVTQALLAWADNVVANAKSDVIDHEHRAAHVGITPIAAT